MSKVFCNVPWKEVHINADGTYHSCGAQPNKISGSIDAGTYNVFKMTIPEWINSQHQIDARHKKLTDQADSLCNMCYHEELLGSSSKRLKENHKSNILQENFDTSFNSSPDYPVFKFSEDNNGLTDNLYPESYHISLGNECNLACRMCSPWASSKIAVQMIKEGTYTGSARLNWTQDESAWNHVVDYICATPNLKFVHLIGGEPLMNPKFEELVDLLLAAGKTDIYLGFTTNGTVFNEGLLQKLNAFRHVDIGVSIECLGELNDLIRQGSDTQTVLDNIDLYLKHRKQGHVYVTVRPVPSALSVHELDALFKWCVSRELDVMTNMLVRPAYQQIAQLPADVKEQLLEKYGQWEYSEPAPVHSNPRDPTWFKQHIDKEVKSIITALKQVNDPALTQELYDKLHLWHWLEKPQIANYFYPNLKA